MRSAAEGRPVAWRERPASRARGLRACRAGLPRAADRRASTGLQIAGIVTATAERQARARDAPTRARAWSPTVDELWGAIDLLVIATPNRAHVPLGARRRGARVAVVVDKPLPVGATSAQRADRGGRAAGVPLTVFQNRRCDGDFLTVRRAASTSGELGRRSLRFESRFERFRPAVGRRLARAADAGRRRRPAARPRRAPRRPGPRAVRPIRCGSTPRSTPPARRGGRRRHVRRARAPAVACARTCG